MAAIVVEAMRCDTVQCSAVQSSARRYDAVGCDESRWSAMRLHVRKEGIQHACMHNNHMCT
jgi:hypothetical protein